MVQPSLFDELHQLHNLLARREPAISDLATGTCTRLDLDPSAATPVWTDGRLALLHAQGAGLRVR
jgi:hypothetical protein